MSDPQGAGAPLTDTQAGSTAQAAATPGPPAGDTEDIAELQRNDLVGRYIVLSRIGAGGMGVVYAAYDPELDRKVALKLLLARGGAGVEIETRMLREAQALAQLSDPNVVAVHDVGALRGRVWIAMEFVDGQTLAQWLRAAGRGWRAILAAFLRAGQGLAAAHAVGLIHRDFKPDNVMITGDDRVRVMDFGLARAERPGAGGTGREYAHLREHAALSVAVTRVGARVGTPRYMAPEQWIGAEADARSDQFSFCVALWEALYGEPPFPRAEGFERPPVAPARSRVPKWIRRALLRGLAHEPGGRWPTMRALLTELRRDPTRRRVGLAAAALVGLTLGALLGGQQLDRARRIAACDAAGQAIGEVWNVERRERVRQAMLTSGAGPAAASLERVIPWIDAHAARWSEARRLSCVQHDVAGALELAAYRRVERCLDDRKAELAELLTLLTGPDRDAMLHAVAAAPGLRAPADCRDPRRLAQPEPPPTLDSSGVEAVRAALLRAATHALAGRQESALRAAEAAEVAAAELADPVSLARARLAVGIHAARQGSVQRARASLEAAYYDASAAGADELAADAAAELAQLIGLQLAEPDGDRALEWARSVDTLHARQGVADDDLRRATIAMTRCRLLRARSDDHALACFQRVLALQQRALGPTHPALIDALLAIGGYFDDHLEDALAQQHFRRARQIAEQALGPAHPQVARVLAEIATSLRHVRAYAAALDAVRRAITIHEQLQGPEAPALGPLLVSRGSILGSIDEDSAGLADALRALAILERVHGPDHPKLMPALNLAANVSIALGREHEALAHYRRALAIAERQPHPRLGTLDTLYTNIGRLQQRMGQHAQALATFQRILPLHEEAGPTSKGVAFRRGDMARSRLALGDPAGALADARRALAISELQRDEMGIGLEHMLIARAELALGRTTEALAEAELALHFIKDGYDEHVGQVEFTLATVLWDRDRPRARRLLAQARAHFRRAGETVTTERPNLEAWISAHPESPEQRR